MEHPLAQHMDCQTLPPALDRYRGRMPDEVGHETRQAFYDQRADLRPGCATDPRQYSMKKVWCPAGRIVMDHNVDPRVYVQRCFTEYGSRMYPTVLTSDTFRVTFSDWYWDTEPDPDHLLDGAVALFARSAGMLKARCTEGVTHHDALTQCIKALDSPAWWFYATAWSEDALARKLAKSTRSYLLRHAQHAYVYSRIFASLWDGIPSRRQS